MIRVALLPARVAVECVWALRTGRDALTGLLHGLDNCQPW